MKLAFRIECPHCGWGFPWSDAYVNQGWLMKPCAHCYELFCFKISIPTINIEISKEPVEYENS